MKDLEIDILAIEKLISIYRCYGFLKGCEILELINKLEPIINTIQDRSNLGKQLLKYIKMGQSSNNNEAFSQDIAKTTIESILTIKNTPNPDFTVINSQVKEHIIDSLANWIESAVLFSDNSNFYQGLLDQCAKYLGPEAYTSDDGSVQDSPLYIKIPELVAKLSNNHKQGQSLVDNSEGFQVSRIDKISLQVENVVNNANEIQPPLYTIYVNGRLLFNTHNFAEGMQALVNGIIS